MAGTQVTGTQVSSGEFKRLLSETQRAEVDGHLAQGLGVACYEDNRGRPILVVPTGGGRGFDIPGYPPAAYGGGTLSMFIPPTPKPRPMRSPLLDYEAPQQIARPRVMPSHTEHPSVQIEMRTSRHPRGDSEFITPLLPGREELQAPQPPSEPLSPAESWWRDALS
jgi:hypothetical protein